MTRIWTVVVAALFTIFSLVSLAMASTADAGPRPERELRRMHSRFGPEAPWITLTLRHRDKLELTTEQVSELERLRKDFRARVEPLYRELGAVEKEIASLLERSPADLDRVKERIQEAERLRSELRFLRVETLEKGRSLLSAEQRDRLKELVSAGRERFHKRGQSS